jgi:hypothetical protein
MSVSGGGQDASFDPEASGLVAACGSTLSILPHQVPELEDQLPAEVDGRRLSRWSVRGRCALEILFGGTGVNVDEMLAEADTPGSPPLDIDAVRYGVAGRASVAKDPPYFVFAAARPDDEDEIGLNLLLLLGGGSFVDVAAASELTGFEARTIGGKEVFVGSPAMLRQSEHQRGTPYLYQTDDTMFLVITDDEAWAIEALSILP